MALARIGINKLSAPAPSHTASFTLSFFTESKLSSQPLINKHRKFISNVISDIKLPQLVLLTILRKERRWTSPTSHINAF